MKDKIRMEKLLKSILLKYKIKDKIKVRFVKKTFYNHKGIKPLMGLNKNIILVYINNFPCKINKVKNEYLRKILKHELIHYLCANSPKVKELRIINQLIDG